MKFLFTILFSFFCLFAICQDGLGVLANSSSSTEMNFNEAKSYIKGKYNFWNNNNKVIIVLPSTKNPSSSKVAQKFYNTNPDGVKRYWLSLVFQGRSTSPVFLDTDKEIAEYILKNPGAIGVVSEEQWKATEEKYRIIISN
ncbi:MAG: hypothetical protein ACK452_16240 [Bacteroidota bacterium]|jgi:hypothetical protein